MNKGVLVYFAVLALLVVIIMLLGFLPASPIHIIPTSTTASTTTTKKTTTATTIQTATVTTTTRPVQCPSPNQTVQITNGNLSTGTFYGWNITGTGFGDFPLNITYANQIGAYYGAPWSGYSRTFALSSTRGSSLSVQPGNATSQVFEVTEPFLNFKIVSPQNNYLYVEILENNTPIIITHYNTYAAAGNPNGPTTFENASIPLGIHLCQNMSVRVVAGVVGGQEQKLQYIAATGFYLSKTALSTPGIIVSQVLH